MNGKGGYRIIDFRKSALTSGQEANVSGAYDAANNPYGKATVVTGLIVGDIEYPDFYAPFIANENTMTSSVVIGGNAISISVKNTDDVTVTVGGG